MKILLSDISGSVDNIEEFLKKADDNVGRMGSLPSNLTLGQIGQVLKSTKAIMDQFTKVVHLTSLNLMILNRADRGD
jgi:hypothetical protein